MKYTNVAYDPLPYNMASATLTTQRVKANDASHCHLLYWLWRRFITKIDRIGLYRNEQLNLAHLQWMRVHRVHRLCTGIRAVRSTQTADWCDRRLPTDDDIIG